MKCALCQNEDAVLCESHIFPEFLYQDVYEGEDHLYYAFSSNSDERASRKRKGVYEELMCRDCESIIQRYEDYASRVLYGGTQIAVQQSPEMITISELEYARFKLFQISLIWRAGVSKRKEFRNVDLGLHAERMREMLFSSSPGEPYEYGCVLSFLPNAHELMRRMILVPDKAPSKILGHTCYRAILGGLFWAFFVSNHLQDFPHREAFFSKEGVLRVFRAAAPAMKFLQQSGSDFMKANSEFIKQINASTAAATKENNVAERKCL
ncbi:MAG: hypothetical protein C0417_03860 [Chlorobiaceae bacterium]|nr:hypothetical protein [Chlorobiaceae bacterium]